MKVAILISSCDAYSHCWPPMLHALKLHWPDCPFPVYVVSNELDMEGAQFLKVGDDRGWGPNLTKALEAIDYDYVLYLQDDFFTNQKIDTAMILQHLEYCTTHQVDYLRLSWPFCDRFKAEDMYCYDWLYLRYSLCLQAAIWRKPLLQQLSAKVNTGWEFERNIARIIAKQGIAVKARVIHSSAFQTAGFPMVEGTAIRKGLWTVAGARFLAENGFADLLPLRKVEGPITTLLMRVSNPIVKAPAALILRGMKVLKLLWL